MPVIYSQWAMLDLLAATEFLLAVGHTSAKSYIQRMQGCIDRHYAIRNPGVAGRIRGTCEWMLRPFPYVAIMKWVGDDVKLIRIMPSAGIRVSRPTPSPRRYQGSTSNTYGPSKT